MESGQREFRAALRAGLRAGGSHRIARESFSGKSGAFRVGGAHRLRSVRKRFDRELRSVRLAGSLQSDQFPRFLQLHDIAAFYRDISGAAAFAAGGFPYTPPAIAAITGTFLGISPDLKTPYSIILNANYSRELPGKVDHGSRLHGPALAPAADGGRRLYAARELQGSRVGHYLAAKRADGIQPGQSLWRRRQAFLTTMPLPRWPQEVMNNPSLVPNLPFVNDVWPGYKNAYFPGSASANYFYSVYGVFGSSFLDSLHAADRISGEYIPGKCLSVPGCYTFFAQQGSTMPMWMNAGEADFHGLTVAFRRRYLERPAVRFQLHLVALDRQRFGGRIGRRRAGRVHPGHLQPERVPRLVGFRHPPQLQREFHVRAAGRQGQVALA